MSILRKVELLLVSLFTFLSFLGTEKKHPRASRANVGLLVNKALPEMA